MQGEIVVRNVDVFNGATCNFSKEVSRAASYWDESKGTDWKCIMISGWGIIG